MTDLHALILASNNNFENLSDIHIQAGQSLWVRSGGILREIESPIIANTDIVTLLSEFIPIGQEVSKFVDTIPEHGDQDFAFELDNMRLRANLFRTRDGKLSISLRKIEDNIPPLRSLRLPDGVKDIVKRSKGLFLVTGPTGSGKSTTLASILNEINHTVPGHIITIEDPVEYVHRSKLCLVSQREVGVDTLEFKNALRSALRQDPDVILIGELRDKETVQTALAAAETGHLVLSTLHTVNARQSIDRITSFFAGDEKAWIQQVLSSVLLGVLSQVLVEGTEGASRMLATEYMANTPGIRQCIRDGQSHMLFNIMETGRAEGHQLLNQDLVHLVQNQEILVENAYYHTYDVPGLERDLGGDQ